MTLKEMLASKMAETGDHPDGPNAPPAPQPPVMAGVRAGFMGRQDATEPLPESWPPDDAAFALGNDLVVVQNPHLESFLAIRRPGKPLLYLLGPMDTVNFPF